MSGKGNRKYKRLVNLVWKMISYKPWLTFFNIILWFYIFAYNIIPAVIVKEFFKKLEGSSNIDKDVIFLLAILGVAALSNMVTVYLGGLCYYVKDYLITGIIKRNMLEKLFKKHGGEALKVSTGDALNHFKDDVREITAILDYGCDFIGTAGFTIFAFIIMFNINPMVTLVVFIPTNIVVLIGKRVSKKIGKYRAQSRKETSKISGFIQEIFSSIQGIKIAGTEKNIVNKLKDLNKERHKAMLKDVTFTQIVNSIYSSTLSIGTSIVLLLCARLITNGEFSVGDFAFFIYCMEYVTDFIQRTGEYITQIKQTDVALDRLEELMGIEKVESLLNTNEIYLNRDIPEKVIDDYDENKIQTEFRNLELNGLGYKYKESENGIKDVSLKIDKGTFTVVTGRIGSGKTTLLKTLIGLLPAQSGEILWNGEKLTRTHEQMIPPKVGYIGQIPHLFSESIGENITLGQSYTEEQIKKAISSAVLEDDIKNMEDGLNTMIGSQGVKLSGGQIQRVAAARMFMKNAELLVLDDISSALDVKTENTLWERLFEKKTATCIAVSNKKVALQRADNIIVMKDGRVEGIGTFQELIEGCEEFRELALI
ncbi:ABC transporter ATP-binding protein [Oceanirhabdus sp. W0125-5]|uniref:ABC transporter ATP-binding protein n=1 Tax=Oceanirhabdus sp. W0125-5 TaxID=2999116 RepID=UPI0022F31834|nr:ABC transporter ATP-binding protein [Oceanirhabdus sp. W0125-5]WBW96817.1 ABC transporter ATP-binding protein [Oceanirhabdus sp. W0125-5]